MNDYKLIKEYPGSPKLGTIISMREGTNMHFYGGLQIQSPNKFPEYWIPFNSMFNLDYEIVRIKNPAGTIITYDKGKCINRNDGLSISCTLDLDQVLLTDPTIIAVKRLSDGVVFSIGDTIEYQVCDKWPPSSRSKIIRFSIYEDTIDIHTDKFTSARSWCSFKGGVRIVNDFSFITQDGVEITSPTTGYYAIYSDTLKFVEGSALLYGEKYKKYNCLTFSTYKAGYDYLCEHQKLFSLSEIRANFLCDLEKRVKQRVNV